VGRCTVRYSQTDHRNLSDWGRPGTVNDEARTRKICCLRETFEESGVVLASGLKHQLLATERQAWRKKVYGDASQFLQFFKEFKCTPDIEVRTHLLAPAVQLTAVAIGASRRLDHA
jgi:ADP-ribose pyrophosphatase YjhB (NUDIX family)